MRPDNIEILWPRDSPYGGWNAEQEFNAETQASDYSAEQTPQRESFVDDPVFWTVMVAGYVAVVPWAFHRYRSQSDF